MCTILFTPRVTLAERTTPPSRTDNPNITTVEDTGDQKPLTLEWVADIDEFGNPRLPMRWRVAPLAKSGKAPRPPRQGT